MDLFSVSDEVGGGLVLWHPRGAMIRKTIEDFWRDEHQKNGYDFVYSPHVEDLVFTEYVAEMRSFFTATNCESNNCLKVRRKRKTPNLLQNNPYFLFP